MVGAIILAAGQAERAGGPKIIWPAAGRPSLRRVAEAALNARGVCEVVAVTGGWAAEAAEVLKGLPVKIVHNPEYSRGQAGSLKAGLESLSRVCRAAVFLLADQPFITSQIIEDLIDFHRQGRYSIVAPSIGGQRKNPAVFSLDRWRIELAALGGDKGARDLIAAHPEELGLRPYSHSEIKCFEDFDTLEDYEALTGESLS